MVPGAGLEPARVFGSTVFETAASTIPPPRLVGWNDTIRGVGALGRWGVGALGRWGVGR